MIGSVQKMEIGGALMSKANITMRAWRKIGQSIKYVRSLESLESLESAGVKNSGALELQSAILEYALERPKAVLECKFIDLENKFLIYYCT